MGKQAFVLRKQVSFCLVLVCLAALALFGSKALAQPAGNGAWTSTNGPWLEQGNVQILTIDQATPGTAYAVVEAAGLYSLYRTTDRAANWALVKTFKEPLNSLAVRGNVLYLGGKDVSAAGDAIWRSADSGVTWMPVYTATGVTQVNALTMQPGSADKVYAALTTGAQGVVLTTTNGVAWTEAFSINGAVNEIVVNPIALTQVFAGGYDAAASQAFVVRSSDSGGNWTTVFTDTEGYDGFLTIHPTNPSILFVKTRPAGCCPPPAANLWRTTNSGQTWAVLRADPLWGMVFARPDTIYSLVDKIYTLNASDPTPTWVNSTGDMPEWMNSTAAVEDRSLLAGSQPAAAEPLVYVGFPIEGVYTTTNHLASYQAANQGFHNLLVPNSIALDPNNENTLFVAADQDGFKSIDAGAHWTPLGFSIQPMSFAVQPGNSNVVLMSGRDNQEHGQSIFRSANAGASWTNVFQHIQPGTTEIARAVAFDPTDPDRVFAISGYWSPGTPSVLSILVSTDAGLTWTPKTTLSLYEGQTNLHVDPDGVVYLTGETFAPFRACVYRSTDHGETWPLVYYDTPGAGILDLAIDPHYPANVYMIDNQKHLLASNDHGDNWTTLYTAASPLYSLLRDPQIPGKLYLGMEGPAVWLSYNAGVTWTELENWQTMLAAPRVISLASNTDPVTRTLYGGLDGVWSYTLVGEKAAITKSTGGTLTFTAPGGELTTIVAPPNAVSENIDLIYMPAFGPSAGATSDMQFAGQAFTLDAYSGQDALEGFTFLEPVTVTIHYDPANIADLQEDSLLLKVWNNAAWTDAAGTCTPSSTYIRNLDENWFSVQICHLSYYALFAKPNYFVYLPIINK